MGLLEQLRARPAKVACAFLHSSAEVERRKVMQRRVLLYRDNAEGVIRAEVARIFSSPEVRAKLCAFARVGNTQSIFKRIINEISRPVYSVPPVRTLSTGQAPFDLLSAEVRLNEKMNLACRLANACNAVFLMTRYVESLGRMLIDVITPDQRTVIPHPDDPLTELAIIYDRDVYLSSGEHVTHHVYWDAERTFEIDEHDNMVPGSQRVHGLPMLPFVALHRQERWACYEDTTTGEDRVNAQLQASILGMLAFRVLKVQGFKQVVFMTPNGGGIAKGQVLDEESALVLADGATATTLDNKSDASNYLALQESVKNDAAANSGLSKQRLNMSDLGADESDDTSLHEQRAEAVQMMRDAELRQFEVMKMVSREHADPSLRLPDDARMTIDFGEVSFRADPKGTLELWQTMRKMGVRNILDDIKTLNPEIRSNDEAKREAQENLDLEGWFLEVRASRNIPVDQTVDAPGQNAATNGAMGPAVRDGRMPPPNGRPAAPMAAPWTQQPVKP